MKIIDQYIYAIGQKLPMRGREDVKQELKSLLLDDIEGKYGENPTEDQLKEAISTFGSPGKVAKKYSGETVVIGSGFTDLYFMILKIMVLAMSITFTVLFVISLFTENLTGLGILQGLGMIPLNVFTSSLSGIGTLTLVFIIITRFVKESQVDLEDDWTPKELKGIPLGEAIESKIESFVSISFLTVFIVIINFFPQLMTLSENSFEKSGLLLGNRINLDQFTLYAILLSLIWIIEIVYHLLILKIGVITKALSSLNIINSILAVILLTIMVSDKNLFVNVEETTIPGLIGFKVIFLIILVVSSIELLVQSGKWVYKTIVKKYVS